MNELKIFVEPSIVNGGLVEGPTPPVTADFSQATTEVRIFIAAPIFPIEREVDIDELVERLRSVVERR